MVKGYLMGFTQIIYFIKYISMNEEEFLSAIDCKFPYNNIVKWMELIDMALGISDTCVYWVIHEIVRTPQSVKWKVNKLYLLELLNYIELHSTQVLKNEILAIARKIISSEEIHKDEVIRIMDKLKYCKWQSYPLNILYFSTDDTDWKIEQKYDEVMEYWRIAWI